jgi:hypothetical protein
MRNAYFCNHNIYGVVLLNKMSITYDILIKSEEDDKLFYYVQYELSKKKYSIFKPITPTEFIFKYILNHQQRRLFISLNLKSKEECPVCYTGLNNSNTIKTSCNHYFCKDCIVKLTEYYSTNCPYCRSNMTSYDELYTNPVNYTLKYLFVPYIYVYSYNITYYIIKNLSWIFLIYQKRCNCDNVYCSF